MNISVSFLSQAPLNQDNPWKAAELNASDDQADP